VRVQGVILEHHRDIPVFGGNIVHQLAVDIQLALGDFLKPRHHAEGSGFTAPGRAYKNDKFLVLDHNVGVFHRPNTAIIHLRNAFQLNFCHRWPPYRVIL